jgi:hypothetical protein
MMSARLETASVQSLSYEVALSGLEEVDVCMRAPFTAKGQPYLSSKVPKDSELRVLKASFRVVRGDWGTVVLSNICREDGEPMFVPVRLSDVPGYPNISPSVGRLSGDTPFSSFRVAASTESGILVMRAVSAVDETVHDINTISTEVPRDFAHNIVSNAKGKLENERLMQSLL